MKILLWLFFITTTISAFGQTENLSIESPAISTVNRDTLFVDTTTIGDVIIGVWESNDYPYTPIIVRVPAITPTIRFKCSEQFRKTMTKFN